MYVTKKEKSLVESLRQHTVAQRGKHVLNFCPLGSNRRNVIDPTIFLRGNNHDTSVVSSSLSCSNALTHLKRKISVIRWNKTSTWCSRATGLAVVLHNAYKLKPVLDTQVCEPVTRSLVPRWERRKSLSITSIDPEKPKDQQPTLTLELETHRWLLNSLILLLILFCNMITVAKCTLRWTWVF